MTANERRAEILRLLVVRRRDTTPRLARELGVSTRTVLRDVEALMCEYPLVTRRGNGGYVAVEEWYHPHRNILSREQRNVLVELLDRCDPRQASVVRQMLREYSDTDQGGPARGEAGAPETQEEEHGGEGNPGRDVHVQ